MFSGLSLVTPPAAEPLSVADAKAHTRVTYGLDDSLIAGYISSARMHCEMILRRALMPQTWLYALEHFPGRHLGIGYRMFSNTQEYYKWNHIEIPLPPLVSIVSFTYTDTQGNVNNMTQGYGSQTGNYILDLLPEPGRVVLPFSGIWPTTILLPGSPIQITYTCGYPSYSGMLAVDGSGVATWESGSNFDPRLAGTWITVGGSSLDVVSVIDSTHLQLSATVTTNAPLPYSGNAVPMPIRHAICFLTAHFYENRETVITGRGEVAVEIPSTVDDLLAPYRIHSFPS